MGACNGTPEALLSHELFWKNFTSLDVSEELVLNKKLLKVAIVGAGSWAVANHMPLLATRDDVKIVAACTLGADKLAALQKLFDVQIVSEDYRDVLEVGPDVVVVSSPPGLHFEHASAAIASGAHVLCEKPFTVRPSDAWNLVQQVQDAGIHLLIPYGWNYSRMAEVAKNAISQVGQIEMMTVHFAAPLRALLTEGRTYSGSWLRSGERVSVHPEFQMTAASYQDALLSGGGFATANVTHALGFALWVTGLRAKSVFARMQLLDRTRADLHDSISVLFEGGSIASISGASTQEGAERHQVDVRIFGSEGQLMVDFERERVWLYRSPDDQMLLDVKPGEGAYDCGAPINVLLDLVNGEKEVNNNSPAELGARVVELLDTAYLSAETGKDEQVATALAGRK